MYTHDPSIDEYRPFMAEANRLLNVFHPDRIEWLLEVWHPFNNHGARSYEIRRNSGVEMSKEDKKANGLGWERMSYELWEAMTDAARTAPIEALDQFFLTAGRLHGMARHKWRLQNPPYSGGMFPIYQLGSRLGCAAALARDGQLIDRVAFIESFPLPECDKPACACRINGVSRYQLERRQRG